METNSVAERFKELFRNEPVLELLAKYGGDADAIFESVQDQWDSKENEPVAAILGVKAVPIDVFAKAAYWYIVDTIRFGYVSSLSREQAEDVLASGGDITVPEDDDIDWTRNEFVTDWNELHKNEEKLKA